MSANLLTATVGSTTLSCQMPTAPSECIPTPQRMQPRDFSQGGTLYLYDRGIKAITYKLTFKKLTDAILTSLFQLADLCSGSEYKLTWYDNAAAAHTVRIIGSIPAKETSPGKYQVSFTLEEYL